MVLGCKGETCLELYSFSSCRLCSPILRSVSPYPAVGQTPSGSTPLLILLTSATDSPFPTRAFRERSSQQLSGV